MTTRGEQRKRHSKVQQQETLTPRPTSCTRSDNDSTSGVLSDVDDRDNLMSYKSDDGARKFFRMLELKNNYPLPEYIKNLLFLNGFASPGTFMALTEEDFGEMERMCRQDMPKYCPHTPEFFSLFFQCIEHFKIPIGHRKQIMGFVDEVSGSTKKGDSKPKKKSLGIDSSSGEVLLLEMKDDPLINESAAREDFSIANYPEVVERARRQIDRGLAGCNCNCPSDKLQIDVIMGEKDIQGSVLCPICSLVIKLSTDARRKDKYGISLLSSSNFIRHVKRHSSTPAEETPTKKKHKGLKRSPLNIKEESSGGELESS